MAKRGCVTYWFTGIALHTMKLHTTSHSHTHPPQPPPPYTHTYIHSSQNVFRMSSYQEDPESKRASSRRSSHTHYWEDPETKRASSHTCYWEDPETKWVSSRASSHTCYWEDPETKWVSFRASFCTLLGRSWERKGSFPYIFLGLAG